MRIEDLVQSLRPLVEESLAGGRFELVELNARYEGSRIAIAVLIDRPEGGVTLDECAAVNRALGDRLETVEFLQQGYVLEVASPGIDRPLKTRRDFERALKKGAKFFLKEQFNGKIEWDGLISTVSEGHVDVETDKGMLQIPLPLIHKAKLLFNGN